MAIDYDSPEYVTIASKDGIVERVRRNTMNPENHDYKIIFHFEKADPLVAYVENAPMSISEVSVALSSKNFQIFSVDEDKEFNVVNMSNVTHFNVVKLNKGETP